MLEVILARQARVVSDGKKILKKKLLKDIIKLIAPLTLILGILAVMLYLAYRYLLYNSVFTAFLGLWLSALDIDLSMIYVLYLERHSPRGPTTVTRSSVVKTMQLAKIFVYMFTVVGILGGSFILATGLIHPRVATSGLTNVSAPITPKEAIVTLLLLISLPLLAYVAKRETEKVTLLEIGSATSA